MRNAMARGMGVRAVGSRAAGAFVAGALVAAVALTGCAADSGTASGPESSSASAASGEVVRMWIAPERAECVGVAPMECLQVAYTESGEAELFYDEIAGFTFEEGTAYVLDVEVTEVADPPADGSSLTYTLVSVVSAEPQ